MIEIDNDRYSITIDPERRRAWIRFLGTGELDTTLEAVRVALKHEMFSASFATVVSFGAATRVDMDANSFRAISAELKTLEKRPLVAALVTGPDVGRYILGRLYVAIAVMLAGRDLQRKAFRTEEEAEAWFLSLEKSTTLEMI